MWKQRTMTNYAGQHLQFYTINIQFDSLFSYKNAIQWHLEYGKFVDSRRFLANGFPKDGQRQDIEIIYANMASLKMAKYKILGLLMILIKFEINSLNIRRVIVLTRSNVTEQGYHYIWLPQLWHSHNYYINERSIRRYYAPPPPPQGVYIAHSRGYRSAHSRSHLIVHSTYHIAANDYFAYHIAPNFQEIAQSTPYLFLHSPLWS